LPKDVGKTGPPLPACAELGHRRARS